MSDSRRLLERGARLERGGVMEEALRVYLAAEAAAVDAAGRSEALRHQADILRMRCDWDAAVERALRAEQIAREAGLHDGAAEAVNARAAIAQSRGDLEGAAKLYAEALELATDPRIRGCELQNLGALCALRGEHIEACRYFEESLAAFKEAKYDRGIAIALNNVGRSALEQGDAVRAEEALQRAVAQARQCGDLDLASVAVVNLAEALMHRGELLRAEEEVSAALGFFKVSGNRWRQVECLKILGDVRVARGEPEVARRLYEQGIALAAAIDERMESALIARRLLALQNATEPPPVDA